MIRLYTDATSLDVLLLLNRKISRWLKSESASLQKSINSRRLLLISNTLNVQLLQIPPSLVATSSLEPLLMSRRTWSWLKNASASWLKHRSSRNWPWISSTQSSQWLRRTLPSLVATTSTVLLPPNKKIWRYSRSENLSWPRHRSSSNWLWISSTQSSQWLRRTLPSLVATTSTVLLLQIQKTWLLPKSVSVFYLRRRLSRTKQLLICIPNAPLYARILPSLVATTSVELPHPNRKIRL
mmetsp:Transcript_15672/g.32425  ORF Transcript_15672/g.32425 Transcript_15672/m.32425 type:complete len:239 (-) Transcript_15672:719-1435(-)